MLKGNARYKQRQDKPGTKKTEKNKMNMGKDNEDAGFKCYTHATFKQIQILILQTNICVACRPQ